MSKTSESGKPKASKPAPAKSRPKAKRKPVKAAKPKPSADEPLQDAEHKALTPMEELFAREYMKDLNATQAYMRANPDVKITSASVMGCRLLARVHISARVAVLKAEQFKRLEIDSDGLLRSVRDIAHADHRGLVEYHRLCCRYCYGDEFRYQRTVGEMERDREEHERNEDERSAKADLLNKAYNRREFDEQGGVGFDGRKDPNTDCPECFGRGHGIPIINDTRKLSPEAVTLYAGVEETKEGIKVKMHDKLKATEMLFKHKGLYEADNAQLRPGPEMSKDVVDKMYADAMAHAADQREAMLARRKQLEKEDEDERKGKPSTGTGTLPDGGATGAS